MSPRFALTYALRALVRGGQRTLLAMVCIAFGVMSLVAMQLMATFVADTLLVDPRAAIGGDLAIDRPGVRLTAEHIAELDRLQAAGDIEAYTLFAASYNLALKREGAARVYYISRGLGVEPDRYPLVGAVVLRDPPARTFGDLISEPGNIVVTRDLAEKHDLRIGETIVLRESSGGLPVTLTVAGVAQSVPDNMGDMIYYSIETARLVTGRPEPVTHATIVGPKPGVAEHLAESGWSVETPEQRVASDKQIAALFDFMLKGAGLLGLMVGGIGVATTLQVLLARRTLEIATLKTLGYRQPHLVGLFGIETAILGMIGSLAGAAAGAGLAAPLLRLLAQTGVMLLEWSLEPTVLASGVLMGTATAIIFGLYAIVRAGSVRPAVLFRDLPARPTGCAQLLSLGLVAGLLLLFTGLSAFIMGSVLQGIGIVAGALVGLVVLGGVFGVGLLVLSWLPLPGPRLMAVARQNLRRDWIRGLFALIALFMGVVAISYAGTITFSAEDRLASLTPSMQGMNLMVFAMRSDAGKVEEALAGQNVEGARLLRYHLPVRTWTTSGSPVPWLNIVEGHPAGTLAEELTIRGEPWGTVENAVYLPRRFEGNLFAESGEAIEPGVEMLIETGDGKSRLVTVAGYFDAGEQSPFGAPSGLLASEALVNSLGSDRTSLVFGATVPAERLEETAESLGSALPESLVASQADQIEALVRAYRNLFLFAVAMSALALLAGVVLIANAVGLAMVERQREVGILKSIGFTSRHVLQIVMTEYGLLGLLGGVAGVLAVAVSAVVINVVQPQAQLTVEPLQALAVIGVTVALAAGVAALVAWRPSRVRPLDVLRSE